MEGNSLFGALPTNIGEMVALQAVSFDANFLSGTIPTELAASPAIRELILSNNFIGGTIPPEIGNMFTLEILNLEGSMQSTQSLTGPIPAQIGNLAFLRKFLMA